MFPRSFSVRRSLSVQCFTLLAAGLAFLALSCASTAELARRSSASLAKGDDHAAWQWGERAMKKDPRSPVARDAMTSVAAQAVPDWERRIRTLAGSDTVGAARLARDFGAVRAELGGWNIPVPLDSAYLDDERTINNGAARILYRRGVDELHAHEPRAAYRDFTEVQEIVPGFRHVEERIRRAFELALVRVAILPLDDDTGSPEVVGELADEMRSRIASEMTEKKYPFLRFLPSDAIFARARPGATLGRDGAIRLGRDIGAQRVVWGRIHGLDTDTHTDHWNERVFRRVTSRDSSGAEQVRYEPVPFETVRRERTVSVSWSFEVVDIDDETVLAARSGTEHVTARTVYTSFDCEGDADEYTFAPPGWKDSKSDEWKGAEAEWKQHYGDWSVPHLLQAAHGAHEHPQYRRDDRDRFFQATHPLVMDDLPPREDLEFVALRPAEDQVWDVLKALEQQAGAK